MIRRIGLLMTGAAFGAAGAVAVADPGALLGNANAASADTYRQLNLFGDVFERVRAQYVEAPDEKALIAAAVNGMLTSLDPHSNYMPPDDFQDMQVQTSGEFGGLGIEVTMENEFIKVVSPIDDTPAFKAGVLAGDLITHLDGEDVMGLSLNEAVDRMRGPVDSKIVITVRREGVADPIEIPITRARIQIQSVKWEIMGDDLGYLRISSFTERTTSGITEGIKRLKAEAGDGGLKGFILDLRNNPGGLLTEAVDVSDSFLDQGEIVSTRGREEDKAQRYSAELGDLVDGLPLIVLINGGSASASEIVAGALQDHKRATIVGTQSFGKGSVQTIIPLGPNGAIRLTTARYYTPSGRSIQARGIDPDIQVIQPLPEELQGKLEARGEASLRGHLVAEDGEEEERAGSLTYVPTERADDEQLKFAISLLHGEEVSEAFPPDPNAGVPN
ncbi:S41 family peptidase [Acuticoccus yangtzensis]|uniref:S41 family peptidase n=1 Tax=Acuticoccus yangtzensis TaxID=1443441 RepID=UPI00094983F8|nr:S41 family peptidase [Acuticoccus yangtzensis]ORE91219.1 C-terminal processing peptidase subfamily protein [Stappia sp. 22II-S9-Z10]